MDTEFVMNGALLIVGAGLLAAGIVSLIRHKTTGQTVFGGIATAIGAVMLLVVLLTTSLSPTSGPESSGKGKNNAPTIDNGALVTGRVTAISRLDSRYPWQIRICVEKVENLGELPNPVG